MSGADPDFRITEEAKNHIRKAFTDWLADLKGHYALKRAEDLAGLRDIGEGFGPCPDGQKLKATAKASGAKALAYVNDLANAVQKYWDATEEVWQAYERTDEGAGAAITAAVAKIEAVQKLLPRDFAPVKTDQGHLVGFE